MFAPLPSSHLFRQSMGRLFGFGIQEARKTAGLSIAEAARLSGMEVSEWMACSPQKSDLQLCGGSFECVFMVKSTQDGL